MKRKKGIRPPQDKVLPPHITRLAFAFIYSVQNGVRPELKSGESWYDRVNPNNGDLVIPYDQWAKKIKERYGHW